ncbi:MAG: hypothetical protein AB7E55_28905, partial [Pigmentiphaga sp.]
MKKCTRDRYSCGPAHRGKRRSGIALTSQCRDNRRSKDQYDEESWHAPFPVAQGTLCRNNMPQFPWLS